MITLNSCSLQVPFIRTFFAGATIREFSISLWFKQDGAAAGPKAVLVTNGDCEPPQSFEIFNQGASSVAECGTTSGTVLSLPSVAVSNDVWQHVAWVYDGSELRYYLGGSLQQQGNIQGDIYTM
ncbi:hypothetical protein NP493_1548g00039 [Ridgeia piscesae]|uniref:LamG domain-containing protein n=1 Tax=Ridgeia piscesae TaxID=27915 RepID=A0AAD9JZM5_RIDPI|nr:hypothetical protein NP493_1548g00039 [Ridgeia piscesae]